MLAQQGRPENWQPCLNGGLVIPVGHVGRDGEKKKKIAAILLVALTCAEREKKQVCWVRVVSGTSIIESIPAMSRISQDVSTISFMSWS